MQQLVGILLIVFLTWLNTRGIRLGKLIQNIFTSAKTLSLLALIVLGLLVGRNSAAIAANFSDLWTPHDVTTIKPDFAIAAPIAATAGAFGLFVAFCVAQVGSLFSSDAWNNITFTAGEVKNPKRNIPLSLAAGTGMVIGLYLLANVAYLCTLPLHQIQTAPDDRVATAALQAIFGPVGAAIMAVAIMISTFGCNNGLILSGARVYYAMAQDGLFFAKTGRLNARHVPAFGLVLQGVWASLLVLPRTRSLGADGAVTYGNLYSNLLDYVVFAVLLFYMLTIAGLFVLRRKQPDAERPYRAFGYPVIPALYILVASAIAIVLLIYKPATSLAGAGHRADRHPRVLPVAQNRLSPARRDEDITRFRLEVYTVHGQSSVCQKTARDAARGDEGGEPAAPGARPGSAHRPRRRRHHRRRHLRADRRGGPRRGRPGADALLRRRRHRLHLRRALLRRVRLDGAGRRLAYTYAYATLGELFAWIIGWDLVLEYAVGSATVANGWSGYFQSVIGQASATSCRWRSANRPVRLRRGHRRLRRRPARCFNLPAVLIVVVDHRGPGQGDHGERQLQRASWWSIKLAAVLFVIVVGAVLHQPGELAPLRPLRLPGSASSATTSPASRTPSGKPLGMLAGAAIIFFAYIGFDSVSTHAEEAKNPQRDVPIGIIASLLICTVLYIAVVGRADRHGAVRPARHRTRRSPTPSSSRRLGWARGAIIAAAGVAGITSVLLVMMLSRPARLPGHGPRRPGPQALLRRRPPDVPHAVEVDDPDRRLRRPRSPASCRSTRCST